ncbi:uncharacterized [Tachysurus ichikawai]
MSRRGKINAGFALLGLDVSGRSPHPSRTFCGPASRTSPREATEVVSFCPPAFLQALLLCPCSTNYIRGNAINRAPGFSSLQQPRRHVAEFWKFSCQAQATLLWAVFEEQPRMNNTSEESELLWWSRDNGRVDTQGLIQKSPNKGWVLVQQNFEDGTLVQPHSPISSGNIPTRDAGHARPSRQIEASDTPFTSPYWVFAQFRRPPDALLSPRDCSRLCPAPKDIILRHGL